MYMMNNLDKKRRDEILDFWFGELKEGEFPDEKRKMWWIKDTDFDNDIKSNFESDLISAKKGELKNWEDSPRGSLALLILLDQFSRNIYRDTEQSFAQDQMALDVCIRGLQKNFDKILHPVERAFYYIPFMHCEDLDMQKKSIEFYSALAEEFSSNLSLSDMLSQNKLFAEKHYVIIKKFGRYPHRNKILGRTSTPEEIKFLQEPGSSF